MGAVEGALGVVHAVVGVDTPLVEGVAVVVVQVVPLQALELVQQIGLGDLEVQDLGVLRRGTYLSSDALAVGDVALVQVAFVAGCTPRVPDIDGHPFLKNQAFISTLDFFQKKIMNPRRQLCLYQCHLFL